MTILAAILSDGFFAAVAALGFGSISNPPRRAFTYIALLAAIGHATRFSLMTYFSINIALASLIAAFFIGLGSLLAGKRIFCPMTALYIPALLPMIPGKFAYNIVLSLLMFLQHSQDSTLHIKYLDMFLTNSLIAGSVIFMLAVGATLPMFIFKKKAFSLTRHPVQKTASRQSFCFHKILKKIRQTVRKKR